MKKYFIIRILVILMYIGVIWYGFSVQNPLGYTVIFIGIIAGIGINYWNYKVNLKDKLEQQKKELK